MHLFNQINATEKFKCPSCKAPLGKKAAAKTLLGFSKCSSCGALLDGDFKFEKNWSIWLAIFFASASVSYGFFSKVWLCFGFGALTLGSCFYSAFMAMEIDLKNR